MNIQGWFPLEWTGLISLHNGLLPHRKSSSEVHANDDLVKRIYLQLLGQWEYIIGYIWDFFEYREEQVDAASYAASCLGQFSFIFINLAVLGLSCGLRDLFFVVACKLLVGACGIWFPDRDRTRVPCIGSTVLATGPPGKSLGQCRFHNGV